MNITMIGSGRVATHLAQALRGAGHTIDAVYSRTPANAAALAVCVESRPYSDIAALPTTSDAYIIAVSDNALPYVAQQLLTGHSHCTVFHTAGSVSIDVLAEFEHYGVFYPMQTFSKERELDFREIPVFVEGDDDDTLTMAIDIAASISDYVAEMSSDDRRHLHLAAVFASNFANHCYAIAAGILSRHGVGFDAMLPLIDETARKAHLMPPAKAQTGPAVRWDTTIIKAQSQMLAEQPDLQHIYDIMSESIHGFALRDTE